MAKDDSVFVSLRCSRDSVATNALGSLDNLERALEMIKDAPVVTKYHWCNSGQSEARMTWTGATLHLEWADSSGPPSQLSQQVLRQLFLQAFQRELDKVKAQR